MRDLHSGHNILVIWSREYGKALLVTRSWTRSTHGLLGRAEQALQRATEWFSQLRVRPRISLTEGGKPAFEFVGSAPQVDIDATIEQLLEFPETVARDHQQRVVIVFDEFQEVLGLDPNVRTQFQLGDAQVVQKALRRLVELELVDAVGRGAYQVPDIFFRAWLARPL